MKEFLTSNQTVGLFIDGDELKIAELSWEKKTICIQRFETLTLALEEKEGNSANVKPLYKLHHSTLPLFKKNSVPVVALDGLQTLVRTLNVKLTKQKDIDATLEFQAEPLIPFSFDQALLASQTLNLSASGSQITLLASQKEDVGDLIHQFTHIGIDPEVIESMPSALAHFGHHYCFKESNRSYFVVHIGKSATECILAKEGTLIASHPIEKGLIDLEMNQEVFIKELLKTQSALSKQSKKFHPTHLMIVGEGANMSLFIDQFAKEFKGELCYPSISDSILLSDFNRYSAAIALALSAQQTVTHQINFRQKEFIFPNPWKRIKKPIFIYVTACLCCAIAFYFLSIQWQHSEEQKIREKYAALLESSNKGYTDFETRFLKEPKNISTFKTEEIQYPNQMSIDDITTRLNFLQSELSSTPSLFNLHPKPARVSDLLAWLATHPNVVGEDGAPLIEFEAITYTMTKRPIETKKKQNYEFRIDIEFTTPIPRVAREFHDALIAENDFVNPKEEVKWSASSDRYKASFFLRNQKPLKNKGV